MTVDLLESRVNCPAPPPPPPTPKPPKFDERTERAIKVACQGPPFPPEVIAALRNLLPPVGGAK